MKNKLFAFIRKLTKRKIFYLSAWPSGVREMSLPVVMLVDVPDVDAVMTFGIGFWVANGKKVVRAKRSKIV